MAKWAIAVLLPLLGGCGSSRSGFADDGCDEISHVEKGLDELTILGFAASEVIAGIPVSITSTEAVYGNGESATIRVEVELGTMVFERSYTTSEDVSCPDTVGVGASTHFFTADGIWDQWLFAEFRLRSRREASITDALAPEEVGGSVVERFAAGPDTGRLVGVSFAVHFVDSNDDGLFGSYGGGNAVQDMGQGLFRFGSDGYAHILWGGVEE